MSRSKSLMDKYNVPIEHLDFDYVRNCENVKKIECVLEILRSGEEGHYPQLMDFTENRLRELDPANKMFRIEHNLVRNSKQVQDDVDAFVSELKQNTNCVVSNVELDQFLPPIRKLNETIPMATTSKSDRIRSCDYDKWDKYDPDTECLKMDLTDEKIRENLIHEKKKQEKLIEVMPATNDILFDQLTETEKKTIADGHRLKGNEFYRSTEYKLAIAEYTKSLEFGKIAAAFNNRAAAHIKMKNHSQAINDCDECLAIEPHNVKAMVRRAEALQFCGRGNDAYRQYARVLKSDPDNALAKKIMKNIPIRLEIEDVRSDSKFQQITPAKQITSKPAITATNDDYDEELRKLIIPKKIVRSKLSAAMSNIKQLCSDKKPTKYSK